MCRHSACKCPPFPRSDITPTPLHSKRSILSKCVHQHERNHRSRHRQVALDDKRSGGVSWKGPEGALTPPTTFRTPKERQEKQPQNRTAEGNWSATGSGHHHALPSCVFLKSWLATVLALPLRRYPGATTALQVTVELAASARSISNHTFAVWCDVAQLATALAFQCWADCLWSLHMQVAVPACSHVDEGSAATSRTRFATPPSTGAVKRGIPRIFSPHRGKKQLGSALSRPWIKLASGTLHVIHWFSGSPHSLAGAIDEWRIGHVTILSGQQLQKCLAQLIVHDPTEVLLFGHA